MHANYKIKYDNTITYNLRGVYIYIERMRSENRSWVGQDGVRAMMGRGSTEQGQADRAVMSQTSD